MTSPTPAERAALKVADAAAEGPASAYGLPNAIVFALGSAGLLMDPETAAELAEYRLQFPALMARDAELEERIELRTSLLRDVQKIARRRTKEANGRRKHGEALKADAERLRAKVAELEALVDAAGGAAEQRHQILDPSEPPLNCFMTGDICAIAIADALADPLAVDVPPAVTA